jgi:hypothetical protein
VYPTCDLASLSPCRTGLQTTSPAVAALLPTPPKLRHHPARCNAPANIKRYIAELKVMGAVTFNYPRGPGWTRSRDKAADRKARALPALYRGKLANIDWLYYNTVQGEVGPCQKRLGRLGDLLQVVVGYWAEVSTDLDRIVRAIL